jgi:hypothetical protein
MQVGIDLVGPLPVTAKGNKYIMTLVITSVDGLKQLVFPIRLLRGWQCSSMSCFAGFVGSMHA